MVRGMMVDQTIKVSLAQSFFAGRYYLHGTKWLRIWNDLGELNTSRNDVYRVQFSPA